ncbi:hypothetical protein CDD82_2055 [Ophiocordyceps australis]|uniref:Uncharacterized protein n=1 Tax=Ophiocordyceps australis TaxID=1399860 RepID=A0A2C5ZJN4_9HYPO|nr:hypothetical protein CDD82_2055 [Ophiocordyceps australis]
MLISVDMATDETLEPPIPVSEPRAPVRTVGRQRPADPAGENQIPILEPSDADSSTYYLGLPHQPLLVARSSSQRWDGQQGPRLQKVMCSLGEHPLIQAWKGEDPTSLKAQIKCLLRKKGVCWRAVSVYRIGFKNDSNKLVRTEVILFITIRYGTLFWHRGRSVALQCKKILENHGIHDVECEIKQPNRR